MPASAPPLDAATLAELTEVVGPGHVLVGADATAGHARDWTGRFVGATPAVVRPGTTVEVAGVLDRCRAAGLAVVPQGGNTGLVGGATPLDGEVVVDLTRLRHVGAVDVAAGRVTVGAGTPLAELQAAAGAAGLAYGVDLAARDTATVGGTVATNAGGVHVLAHGPTRHQLLGIEAVLADGTVLSHLGGLVKDNTGYDLAGLLCGSEGTLGVITAVTVRLLRPPAHRTVALVGLASSAEAVAAMGTWRREVPGLLAVELVEGRLLALVQDHTGLAPPLQGRHAAVVLVEAGGEDPTTALAHTVGVDPRAKEVAVATDPAGCARLWAYRERATEAISSLGPPHKLDVTLPHDELAGFLDAVAATVAAAAPGATTWLFGHLGDGNVHVNVSGVDPGDATVDRVVLELVAARGGSISAEHGIGVAKRDHLHLTRSPEEIAAFRAIKAALDPSGTLAPNALLPPVVAPGGGGVSPPTARGGAAPRPAPPGDRS